MIIGIFSNNFEPILSGVSLSVENFKKGLEKLGHKVFVFAPKFKGYEDKKDDIFRYPSIKAQYRFNYPIPLPSTKDDDFAKKHKLDLIHSQHPWGVGLYALNLSRKLGIPIIFTNHTRYSFYIDYLPKIVPPRILAALVERSVARYANKTDGVIAPTKDIKEHLLQKGVRVPIYVVPTGVDQKVLTQAPPGELKKRFNIPEDHKIIFNLSRLAPEKNVTTLIKAFSYVVEDYEKVVLVIADDGPDKEKLKKFARDLGLDDKVFFLGKIPFEERGGYFGEGYVLMHSSLSETQGLVMVDSMTMGVPVIAIKATGVVDIIEDGKSGLITQNSAEALAQAVIKVLKDPKLRERLSKGARERSKVYSIDPIAKKMEQVYKTVLKKST